jgi:hypothetical protein
MAVKTMNPEPPPITLATPEKQIYPGGGSGSGRPSEGKMFPRGTK